MATPLVRAQGSLVRDLSPALNLLNQRFGTPQSRAADRSAQAAAEEEATARAGLTTGTPEERNKALIDFTAINPEAGKALFEMGKRGDELELAKAQKVLTEGGNRALLLQRMPDHASRVRELRSQAAQKAARGEDPRDLIDMSNMTEPQMRVKMDKMIFSAAAGNKAAANFIKEQQKANFASEGKGIPLSTKSASFLVEEDGQKIVVTPILDQRTGELVLDRQPLSGELISRLGETPAEQMGRAIKESRGKAEAKFDEEVKSAGEIAGATLRGAGQEKRQQAFINDGLASAQGIPLLNRSIELLDSIETGGIDAAKLRILQFFGVEGADELELSTNLGIEAVGQYRKALGAQFTETEAAKLDRILANFGKSTAGNRRLLTQAKTIALRIAQRGIKAAAEAEDFSTAQEIKDLLEFKLTPNAKSKAITVDF